MKSDLRGKRSFMNRNVDEMIRLCQRATDTGVWTAQEAKLYIARLNSLRARVNADFRELTGAHDGANGALERARE